MIRRLPNRGMRSGRARPSVGVRQGMQVAHALSRRATRLSRAPRPDRHPRRDHWRDLPQPALPLRQARTIVIRPGRRRRRGGQVLRADRVHASGDQYVHAVASQLALGVRIVLGHSRTAEAHEVPMPSSRAFEQLRPDVPADEVGAAVLGASRRVERSSLLSIPDAAALARVACGT